MVEPVARQHPGVMYLYPLSARPNTGRAFPAALEYD